jgi:hypothetical protein
MRMPMSQKRCPSRGTEGSNPTLSRRESRANLKTTLLGFDRLVPIGERSIARDHETVRDPRQIGCEILGDSIREILLLRIVAQIDKGQHYVRQTWRGSGPRDWRGGLHA